ncbi:MAG: nucleoside phosphorylase [Proteobacteria bacterium]|nr:nucleoside phosphorylase [Pseudomonadota bacterium]
MIINPSAFSLPPINEQVLLFFNLKQFYQFKEQVQGTKIKSFGPSRRFNFIHQGIPVTAIGGMIGAPLATITIEHAIQSGGKNFLSFGSAGCLAEKVLDIGQLLTVRNGYDETGISQDYGQESSLSQFRKLKEIETCDSIVSVNSFYRLSIDKVNRYRQQGVILIDMESAALNQVIKYLGGSYRALFVVSDRIEKDFTWKNGSKNSAFLEGVLEAIKILPEILISD